MKKENSKKEKVINLHRSIWIPIAKLLIINGALLRILLFLTTDSSNGLIASIISNPTLWNVFWAGAILLVSIFSSLFIYLSWTNNLYKVGKDQVVHHKGVFWRRKITLRFPSLDKIVIKQGFLGKIFNFGTLKILSTETQENISLKHIPRPRYYSDFIKEQFPGPERL